MPVGMAKINKAGNSNCWRGCGERGTLTHSWWEWKLVQTLWETVWRSLKKLKIELPCDPGVALLGNYPKDIDVVMRRAICTPMFIAAFFTIVNHGRSRDALQQMTGLRSCSPYIQWNITQLSERTSSQHFLQHGWQWRR